MALNPTIAIITNLEMEHTDCYANIEELESAFLQFCNSIPFYGEIILCADSEPLMKLSNSIKKPIVTYGTVSDADFRADNIIFNQNCSEYDFFIKKKTR